MFPECGNAAPARGIGQEIFLGFDIGGTAIKGGIVTLSGRVLTRGSVATCGAGGVSGVLDAMERLTETLLSGAGVERSALSGLGIGSAGLVDAKAGAVRSAANLGWTDVPLVSLVRDRLGVRNVKIANDANAAALGESFLGAGKGMGDSILLTLGTGVGGGMVLDGKIYEGAGGAGAELGHMVIRAGGEACGCGRHGCLEAYCSATALIRDAKAAITRNPDCKMRAAERIEGRTPFDYASIDADAKRIVDDYIGNLAVGIGNLTFIFRPQAIILGGGVSAQGDRLLLPLDERLRKEMGGYYLPKVELRCATLGNDAGFIGAAALCF